MPRRRATARANGARDLFEGRFSEILIIFVLALIVLGPEKLPRLVSEVGRWVGRARGMARQFREQLEEEVQLEEARKAQRAAAPASAAQHTAVDPHAPADIPPAAQASAEPPVTAAAAADPPVAPPPETVVTDTTFAHAHPTDETGADPEAVRPSPAPSADERRT